MKRTALIEFRGDRTQEEMGKRYGVTQQAWAQWESGTTSPKIAVMMQIQKDSGKPIEVLFFDLFNNKNLSDVPAESEVPRETET